VVARGDENPGGIKGLVKALLAEDPYRCFREDQRGGMKSLLLHVNKLKLLRQKKNMLLSASSHSWESQHP